jgi:DNA-binding NtrC family response regulator
MKQSIFYLDDEAACLSIFQATFGRDYDVRTATTLVEARLMLSEDPADIVIADQLMPEMAGTDFLHEVAEKYPASCRVLLTGGVMVGHVIGEVSAGVIQFFVAKPWTEADMREMLERASVALDLRGKRT